MKKSAVINKSAVIAVAMAFGSSALAAGIDSRTYTCAGLHAVIAAKAFVFISTPRFQDFVVANPYYCSGGDRVELRTVATSDTSQCVVRYCAARPNDEAS